MRRVVNEASETEARSGLSEEACSNLLKAIAKAVSRVCPAWLVDRRDDLAQAAMMKVMEIHRKSEGDRELSTSYLYKVAHSALVDEIRRIRRRREVAFEVDGGSEGHAVALDDPERSAAAEQIGRGIRDCLAAMKRERRLAVTLHLQGHRIAEAAKLLDCGEKRAENLVYRGLEDLRRCLSAKGFEP
jgi:RNA polymerase sigma-70 factor (ECF subfamily)